LGELVQTTDGKWITRPRSRCPNGHPLAPNQVLVGMSPPRLRRRWAHHLALPNLRRSHLRPTAQHSLHGARRACGGADLDCTGL